MKQSDKKDIGGIIITAVLAYMVGSMIVNWYF